MRERILGTWRLLSWEWHDAKGAVGSPLGDDPVGQLIYDASGAMSAQLMRRDRSRFQSENFLDATPEEKTASWSGYFGYFGTFAVDEAGGTVVHHVEGSSFPNMIGTDQLRLAKLDGDRLSLVAEAPWGHVGIVWQRARRDR